MPLVSSCSSQLFSRARRPELCSIRVRDVVNVDFLHKLGRVGVKVVGVVYCVGENVDMTY